MRCCAWNSGSSMGFSTCARGAWSMAGVQPNGDMMGASWRKTMFQPGGKCMQMPFSAGFQVTDMLDPSLPPLGTRFEGLASPEIRAILTV